MPIFISTGSTTSTLWLQISTALTPVVSVIGALLVVQRTNKGNATAQKDRLKHEATEAEKRRFHDDHQARLERDHADKKAELERLHSNRKEMAKEAVKALVSLNAYLGTIATNPYAIDGTPLKEFQIAAVQLQIVVEPDTAAKIERLVAEYTKLHLILLAKITPVMKIQNQLDFSIKRLNEPNSSPADRIAAQNQIAHLKPQLLNLQIDVMGMVLTENEKISKLRFDTLSAIRQDMFADGDINEVQRAFEEGWAEMKPLFGDLFKAVKDNS